MNQEVKLNTIGAAYGNSFLSALAIGEVQRSDIDLWNPKEETIYSIPNKKYSEMYDLYKSIYNQTYNLMGW